MACWSRGTKAGSHSPISLDFMFIHVFRIVRHASHSLDCFGQLPFISHEGVGAVGWGRGHLILKLPKLQNKTLLPSLFNRLFVRITSEPGFDFQVTAEQGCMCECINPHKTLSKEQVYEVNIHLIYLSTYKFHYFSFHPASLRFI